MAATLFACGSDDSTTMPPAPDAGNDSSTAMDAAKDSPTTTDAPSTTDATNDVSTVVDSGRDASDSSVDAADATVAPLAPLDLCLVLDADAAFDIATIAGTATPPVPASTDDRVGSWVNSITLNIPQGGTGYVPNLIQNDCRTNGIVSLFKEPDGAGNDTALAAFSNQIAAVVLQFMGCGQADAGAATFADLVPPAANGHVFTTADLAALTDIFTDSIIQGASYEWFVSYANNGTPPLPEPLTSDQVDAIKAHVAALAPMPGVLNSTRLTFSTCTTGDGGADASADSSTDAGHD
jgi:hypothetical protein